MPESASRTPRPWPVARVSEIPPGERKIVEVEGRSIGLFNVHGTFVAVLNVCPHQQAPVCRGRLGGTTLPSPPGEFRWGRDGEILACPWHGWEFDLLTGRPLADRRRHLRRYSVTIKDDTVFITI
jgi:3-phenylpropionate/trans-cinnamate dioxygenase ferredoxin subunit